MRNPGLPRPLHLVFALLLAVGLNMSAATQSQAHKGRYIAGAILGGLAAAAIISAHRHRHYRPHYYVAPRRCYSRRHCYYDEYGHRYCHRDRICGRRRYCPY